MSKITETVVEFDNYNKNSRVPKKGKRTSNLSFLEKLKDLWFKCLEHLFAKGCFYIGKSIRDKIMEGEGPASCPAISVVTKEKDKDFGVNARIFLNSTKSFKGNIVKVPVLWGKLGNLYFFKPIQNKEISLAFAISKRSFFDGETIVFDGMNLGNEYHLNLPQNILNILEGTTSGGRPSSPLIEIVRERNENDTTVIIDCKQTDKVFIPIIFVDDQGGVTRKEYSKRSVCGYSVVRGDKTEVDFKHKLIKLAEGTTTLSLGHDDANELFKVLTSFNNTYGLFYGGDEIDELYYGKDALYGRWHRWWTNSIDRFPFILYFPCHPAM